MCGIAVISVLPVAPVVLEALAFVIVNAVVRGGHPHLRDTP